MDQKDLCLLIVVFLACGTDAMTRQQLKNSSKMLKKNCMAKIGVPEEKIANIEKGEFIEEKEVMCYIACIFQMTQVVKNNKLNYEASIKQVDLMYPPELKEPVKASIEKCKDVSKKYKDLCEASYWAAKCMYENDPKTFIFPCIAVGIEPLGSLEWYMPVERVRCSPYSFDYKGYVYLDGAAPDGSVKKFELRNAQIGASLGCSNLDKHYTIHLRQNHDFFNTRTRFGKYKRKDKNAVPFVDKYYSSTNLGYYKNDSANKTGNKLSPLPYIVTSLSKLLRSHCKLGSSKNTKFDNVNYKRPFDEFKRSDEEKRHTERKPNVEGPTNLKVLLHLAFGPLTNSNGYKELDAVVDVLQCVKEYKLNLPGKLPKNMEEEMFSKPPPCLPPLGPPPILHPPKHTALPLPCCPRRERKKQKKSRK